MGLHRLSHGVAVALGVPAAAAPAGMFLAGLVSSSPPVGVPVVQQVLGIAGMVPLVPLVVLRVAAVVLVVRAGWARTAGLVLLAGGGLEALRDVHVLAVMDTLWAAPFFMLAPVAMVTGTLAGVAACVALYAGGPRPQAGPRRSGGWRVLAAVAAMSPAAIELGQARVSAGRGAPPGFLLGELAWVLVGVVVAVAALRVADGRVVALLVAMPGAGALAEAARPVQQMGALTTPVEAVPAPLLAVRLLAAIALAVAAAGLWATSRPLRDAPLAAARGTGTSS